MGSTIRHSKLSGWRLISDGFQRGPKELGKVTALSQEILETATSPSTGRDKRFPFMLVSGALSVVLAVAAMTIPVPYVVESPGPAINTIGTFNGKPIITISGHENFPATSGSLDLTTVHLTGGLPDSRISFFDALQSWLTPSHTLYPAELIYAPGVSQETVNSENSAAMTGSQENATAAALTALSIPFESSLTVASIPADGAASGILNPDDVLLTVGGRKFTDLSVVQEVLAEGKGAPVELTVLRDGVEKTVSVTPKLGEAGKYLLGISTQNTFKFPFEVKISLENVGGPSAGMIFALGIMDNLTPGELTGGKKFAGTGTIDPAGKVGGIGGIAQKMVGAQQNGADYFLAPGANCGDVVGHIPNGLQVIKVDTLEEAYDAVSLIGSGKDGSALPSCT
ncbi:signal protein PDZ [Arthrobacter glacialis]|uniref:endopeptidase La n=2 Tax=Arthrobacter glacialis TaxID=1664 RepID=A0A2S3ZST0_ARTGL|nr:signal protein PDZ [Arthrobacter glacialis]